MTYRYADGPHDVEAMYVARDGTVYLITKRPLKNANGMPREALVFALPPEAWMHSPATAALVDSVPIAPGSAPMRLITDASLSPNGRLLAVRTYAQVYVFATDAATTVDPTAERGAHEAAGGGEHREHAHGRDRGAANAADDASNAREPDGAFGRGPPPVEQSPGAVRAHRDVRRGQPP